MYKDSYSTLESSTLGIELSSFNTQYKPVLSFLLLNFNKSRILLFYRSSRRNLLSFEPKLNYPTFVQKFP